MQTNLDIMWNICNWHLPVGTNLPCVASCLKWGNRRTWGKKWSLWEYFVCNKSSKDLGGISWMPITKWDRKLHRYMKTINIEAVIHTVERKMRAFPFQLDGNASANNIEKVSRMISYLKTSILTLLLLLKSNKVFILEKYTIFGFSFSKSWLEAGYLL